MSKSKWMPPIPSEKLYSPQALKLGAGLALLVWCYDGIESDGTVKIEIKKAAADLGTAYRTVRDWWELLRNSNIFTNVQDRGRLGYVATFHSDWIEWRIMKANYPTIDAVQGRKSALENDSSNPNEGQSTALEEPEMVLDDVESPLKYISSTNEGRKSALETSAYKVLNTPENQECLSAAVDTADAPPVESKPKPRSRHRKPAEEPTPLEVRQALAAGCQINLDTGLKDDIVLVNVAAAKLYAQRKPDQSAAQFAADVRACGRWVRETQHPYRGSQQRIPPSALVKFWEAWQQSIKPPQAQPPRQYTPPPSVLPAGMTLAQARARTAEIVHQYESAKAGAE